MRRRILLVLAALIGAVFLGAGPAAADCRTPPYPTSPTGGVSGMIDPGPAHPVPGDPFVKAPPGQPQPTIYDTYGWGGVDVVRFDPAQNVPGSCVNVDLSGSGVNAFTNFCIGIMAFLTALCVWLFRQVLNPVFMTKLFDPLMATAAKVIGNGLFLPLIGVVLAATGIYFLRWADTKSVGEVTEKAATAALIVATGVLFLVYPVVVGATADKAIGQVVTTASSITTPTDGTHTPVDTLASTIQSSLIYATWQQATFGTGVEAEKAAAEYGPRLFKAGAFTRAEQKAIDADPSVAAQMVTDHQDAYKKLAGEIEQKYPGPYQYLKGDHAAAQLGFALLGLVAVVMSAAFLILALTRLWGAMFIVRATIALAPGLALASTFPTLQHLFKAAQRTVFNAFTAAIYFGFGAILFIVAGVGGVMNPALNVPPLWKLVGLILLTWGLWHYARKFGFLAREEKALRKARDAAMRAMRRPGDEGPTPAPVPAEEGPYRMHAEVPPRPRPAAPVVRAIGGTVRTAGLIGAAAATGGTSTAGVAAKSAATATVRKAGTATARQVGSSTVRQIGSRPSGPVIHPVTGGRPPGPSKAAATRGGVAVIHSMEGSRR